MFNPRPFRVTDQRKIVYFIREHSLGMVYSSDEGKYGVSHIPFLVDDNLKVLTGHMARANPQWKRLNGADVLIVFRGPQHYISPVWYGEEYAVPTWNYLAAHIWGKFKIVEDQGERISVLDQIVEKFEDDIGGSWQADWSKDEYLKMMDQIVVFRIEIERAEGKWKLSQNHPVFAWKNVAQALQSTDDEGKRLAEIMLNDPQMHEV